MISLGMGSKNVEDQMGRMSKASPMLILNLLLNTSNAKYRIQR